MRRIRLGPGPCRCGKRQAASALLVRLGRRVARSMRGSRVRAGAGASPATWARKREEERMRKTVRENVGKQFYVTVTDFDALLAEGKKEETE